MSKNDFLNYLVVLINPNTPECHRWTKAHDILVAQKIRKDKLAIMVRESEAMLRSENLLTFKCRKCV